MGAKTPIQWTGSSLTPIRARNKLTGKVGWHCVKVSRGCDNCYSEELNRRLGCALPFDPAGGRGVELFLDQQMLEHPKHWRAGRRIFWCSMTDLFLKDHPDAWIQSCFDMMEATPQHTHQVLTKRAERMVRFIQERYMRQHRALPPSIHLGVSVESRALLRRLAVLQHIAFDAPLLWCSFEPLLEDLGDLSDYQWLDWAVWGGESGPRARPCHIDWIRAGMRQLPNTRHFVKQLGARPEWPRFEYQELRDRKGGDAAEWPVDLRVRDYP